MLDVTIKDKPYQLKFNYSAFFRANKLFSTSENANDGASVLWMSLVTGEDTALFDALRVLLPASVKDADIFEALDAIDAKNGVDKFASDIEEEIKKSGFFRRATKRWLKLTEKYSKQAAVKGGTEAEQAQQKAQAQAMKDTLDAVRKSLS